MQSGERVVRSNYGTGGDPKARGQRIGNQPAATITGKADRNHVLETPKATQRFN